MCIKGKTAKIYNYSKFVAEAVKLDAGTTVIAVDPSKIEKASPSGYYEFG